MSYGAASTTEVSDSPNLKATVEQGAVYGYFLGSSVPTGAQTVTVSSGGASGEKQACAITVTASANTAVEATDASINSDAFDDPSGTLATGASVETFIAAVLFSGIADSGNIGPGSGYTQIIETDTVNQFFSFMRRTSNATGGNVTYAWSTSQTEDAVALAVAIREEAAAAPATGQGSRCLLLGVC